MPLSHEVGDVTPQSAPLCSAPVPRFRSSWGRCPGGGRALDNTRRLIRPRPGGGIDFLADHPPKAGVLVDFRRINRFGVVDGTALPLAWPARVPVKVPSMRPVSLRFWPLALDLQTMRAAHWQLNPRIRDYLMGSPEARRTLQRMARTGSNVEELANEDGSDEGKVVFERLQPQHPRVAPSVHPTRVDR